MMSMPWRYGVLLVAAAAGLVGAPAAAAELVFTPVGGVVETDPPPPPVGVFPVQLILDDDSVEGVLGVISGQNAQQFLWFNRFTPAEDFRLEEVWVFFAPDPNMAVGDAIQLAIYQDLDGNPANGANLLATFDETIQVLDGNTFSVYPLSPSVVFEGGGDLLIGVVPRFIQSGVTPAVSPATLDTTASQVRSWLGIWSGDVPDPPVLPPDQLIMTVDGFLPGNWMVRGFGTRLAVIEIPTLNGFGLALLAAALLAAGLVLARRRVAAASTTADRKQ